MKKKILVICFKDLDKNLRGIKQINLLKNSYHIDYAGFSDFSNDIKGNFFKIDAKFRSFGFVDKLLSFIYLLLGLHKLAFNKLYHFEDVKKAIEQNHYDLIISHDIKPLHIIYSMISTPIDSKIFLDAHEYFKGLGSTIVDKVIYKRFNLSSYKFITKVNHIDTVCESIANFYKKEFPHIPVTYTINVPPSHDLYPTLVLKDKIKIVHHGYADPNRHLELMIETMKFADNRFTLDLYLISPDNTENSYIKSLKLLCKELKNVNILPPMKPQDIIQTINQYDIGLYILPDQIANMKFALPNKIFDFIQARLMVAIGPSFEMSKLVKKYDVGIVSQSFDPKEMANNLKALSTEDIFQYKLNSNEAAKELSSEVQLKKLSNTIEELINS